MSTPNQQILAAAAIGSAAAAWLPSAGVWAQTAEAPSAALEEVVITAERREASVLRTPIVITAVTGEQLAEEHLTIIADLQSTVPDLSVTTNGAFAVISIRGIGGSISPASAAGPWLSCAQRPSGRPPCVMAHPTIGRCPESAYRRMLVERPATSTQARS